MAKKNLKHALRAHEAKKLQASKVKSIEEAAKRKAISIRTGKQPKSKRKGEQAAKSLTNPFRKEDTILLVGEGEEGIKGLGRCRDLTCSSLAQHKATSRLPSLSYSHLTVIRQTSSLRQH